MYLKTDMKNSRFQHIYSHFGVAIVTAVLFGSIGTYFVHLSSAATSGTSMSATNSKLTSGNQLASPDGGVKLQMQTDGNLVLRNWQNTAIWYTGTQGKGATYLVFQTDSNIVLRSNVGATIWSAYTQGKGGTTLSVLNNGNLAMTNNSGTVVWQTNTAGKQGTPPASGGTTPTPTPAPTPAPAPAPSPTPAPVSSNSSSKSSSSSSTKSTKATATATPALSNAADANVTTGTTLANLSIPKDNASTLYIRYGTDAANLDHSSDVQTIASDPVPIQLTGLTAQKTYTYQIVRTLGSQTTTSPNASFTTQGYSITLLFTDKNNKPVKGISGQLGNGKVMSSGIDGKLSFAELAAGSYSPIFSYGGQSYSEDFSTSSAGVETGVNGVTLTKTVNLSKLQQTAVVATPPQLAASTKKNHLAVMLIAVVLGLVAAWAVWWFVRGRRRAAAELEAQNLQQSGAAYLPQPVVVNAEPVDAQAVVTAVAHHKQRRAKKGEAAAPAPVPAPAHIGESLRDMVVKSMAEDAAKHPDEHKNRPAVPGQQ